MNSDNNFFYKLAIGSITFSAVSMLFIGLSVPFLYSKSSSNWEVIQNKAKIFKENTNKIWSELQVIQNRNVETNQPTNVIFFSRKPRQVFGQQVCSGCIQLNCPIGSPGLPGPPGEDGLPGENGLPGEPGEDGFDIELEPENDLPCIICPAGPPGQRGLQGERGQLGPKGPQGDEGLEGERGDDGPPGLPGPKGKPGIKGNIGLPGPKGDDLIAGIGIPGPRGPKGPPGPKGPNGPPGKPSQNSGLPGKIGPRGPFGPPGNPGHPGEDGLTGPPGEPGQPAAYCPSDCGVTKILAPSIHLINEPKPPSIEIQNKQIEIEPSEEKNEYFLKN